MAFHQLLQTLRPRKSSRFQIMSDLHLEVGQQYSAFNVLPTAPYLVLAGDIGQLSNYELYLSFLRLQCDQFSRVFLVLGNHEFFGMSHDHGIHIASCLEKEPILLGRLVVLHRRRYDFVENPDITVLGCTLWSRIQPEARQIVESKVKDFRRIHDWGVDKHNAEHDKDVDWLQKQVEMIRKEPNGLHRRIIIVTHPRRRCSKHPSPAIPKTHGLQPLQAISLETRTPLSSQMCNGGYLDTRTTLPTSRNTVSKLLATNVATHFQRKLNMQNQPLYASHSART